MILFTFVLYCMLLLFMAAILRDTAISAQDTLTQNYEEREALISCAQQQCIISVHTGQMKTPEECANKKILDSWAAINLSPREYIIYSDWEREYLFREIILAWLGFCGTMALLFFSVGFALYVTETSKNVQDKKRIGMAYTENIECSILSSVEQV